MRFRNHAKRFEECLHARQIRSAKVYDDRCRSLARGASGGTAAEVLTGGGLNVVLLEAGGPKVDPSKDFEEHVWPYELPHRGIGLKGGEHRGELNDEFVAPNGFWEIDGEPYTAAPGSRFPVALAPASSAGGRITGDALRYVLHQWIFERDRRMEWATIGRSPTMT